ncbi:MAG: hypothetical protein ACJ8AW_17025 [Rhodopila sp.]
MRLIETGIDSPPRVIDVMDIEAFGDLGDIAKLGLMRHHTALEVICENCARRAVLNNRFLSRNYGISVCL